MILVSQVPYLDPNTLGWVYVGTDENGELWVRSIGGKWVRLAPPLDTDSLSKEFEGITEATVAEVIADAKGGVVVAPTALQDVSNVAIKVP